MSLFTKKKSGFLLFKKMVPLTALVATLVMQPMYGVVSALQTTVYTTKDFTQAELDANWGPERIAPSGGFTSVDDFGRTNVAKLSIDSSKPYVYPADEGSQTYYNLQGIKTPKGPADNFTNGGNYGQAVKVDLYLDPAWAGTAVRAGLWTVDDNGSGAISGYFGIVEFANIAGYTGFRYFSDTGYKSIPGFTGYGNWVTLEIELDTVANQYKYSVGGTQVATSPSAPNSTYLRNVLLNHRNFGLYPEAGLNTNSYAAHWDNFSYGSKQFVSETPTNLRLKDANGATILCGGATNINFITPTWNSVIDAVRYNYKVTLPNGSTYGPTNVGNVTSVSGAFGALGTSTFSVQAVYADGQTSAWASSCAITYDATAPTTPTLLTPVHTGFSNVNDFYFDWTDSTDTTPVTYEFQSSQSPATTAGVLTTSVWNNIAHGNAEQKTLTASTVHSTGANGTWYWQVRALDAAGNKSAWTPVWKLTIDMQKPAVTVTSPLSGAYVSTRTTSGMLQVKGSIADANPNYAYVQFLTEQHGAIEGKTIYGAFAPNSLLTSFETAGLVDGKYGLNIAAADGAGNVFNLAQTSGYVDFTLDNTKPTIALNNLDTLLNPSTISVTAGDNIRLKLVTMNIYNESNTTLVRSCSKNVSADNITSYTLDTCSITGLADGVYTIRTNAMDMAGNISSTLSSTKFTIDSTPPAVDVTPQDFGVGSWTLAGEGFTGVNVGFAISNFKTVTGITVDLYDQNGKFVTNTATPTFASLISSEGWSVLSAPFVVSGTLNDTWCDGGPCWVAGSHTWTAANKPVKTVITVTGTNTLGLPATKTAENTNFTEAAATFASILPVASPEDKFTRNNNPNAPAVATAEIRPTLPAPAAARARVAVLTNNPSVGSNVAELEPEVLGEETTSPSAVTATTLTQGSEAQQVAPAKSKLSGLWWTIAALFVLTGAMWIFAAYRRSDNEK